MANLKQSGTRISQYQPAQVNTNEQKDKLLLNHFLISYAPAYYGIGTVNKNFKVPVQSLRDDFKGYIGLVNAKGDWRNSIRFWSGNWSDADRTNSYIYKWDTTLRGEYDYISNKFDVEQGIDKIFLLKTAPWPLEAEQADPAPESNKFVNKKYIDDRFNGIRKVKTSNATLQIRPYPCVYEYSTMPSSINIVDTLTLEDGRKIKDCIEKNCLIFYIKLPIPTSTTLSVKANNVDTKWGFSGELTQLLSTAKKNADSGLIKCYAEYINGTFTVHCTNGMNLKPGEGGTVEIDTTDTIVDGSDAVPTSNAVHDFVKEEIKPKLEEVVAGDTFIEVKNKNEVFVNTSSIIFNDDTTVPTTKAVHDSLESLIIESQYNDFVFDLSNLFYEQINNQWCELMVTLSVNEIEIPYREKYYTNVGSLTISGITAESNPSSPSVTTTGFELESFVIDAIKTKLMNVAKTGNQTDLNNVIANYQNDIPYKAAWVRDAKALNIPTQLAFRHSSYRTNEILRMFFYYLDQEYGKTWGADDAYSKKFMVPGLTYKCLTRPDTTFPTEQYYSYVYNIWLGDRGDTDRTMVAWNFKPSYLAIGSYPNESHGANWDGDSFTMPINWDTFVNEQAWDSFLVDYDTFKTTTVPHVANKEIHLTPEEKAQLFKTKFVVTSKPDLTGSQSSGAVGGFVLEPTSDVKTDKIVMKGISGLVSNILYIWKDTADGIVTVLQNPTKSIVDGTTHTWNFNETLTFNANERYYFTWHNAVNSNAIAPSARPERGHTPSVQKYSHVQGQIFALKTTQFFTSADVDRNNTVDCTFYLKNGKEPVAPSPESVQTIANDVKTIKSELTALQNTVKHDIEFVQETMSFGESNINQNSNSNCYGITFIAQENATIDTLTIKTANSGYFSKVENLYAIIHEEQEDGTKKEIASMETPVNLSSSNTQYKLTFYPFAITKDKKYFVEFIQKNTETGSFNDTRTQVNLGLLNDASASGVLSQSSRSSWSVNYANQYSPILKLSQEMFIMGNLALSNDMQYPLSLVAKMNGEDATNIVLLKPFVTASTDINIESVTNGHVLGIILEKNENTVAGEHYLGIKTLYINKETNEMKEVLLHSPLTIIE